MARSVLPPLQGAIIDLGTVGPLPAVRASFLLPTVCIVVIAWYGRFADAGSRSLEGALRRALAS